MERSRAAPGGTARATRRNFINPVSAGEFLNPKESPAG
jgi:hypothetical protein